MFPYPSGAGLHVGHPLGYIASDIYARYKRLQGFNVLNPMGYDAYGLPAEQYAIQTGQHPAITTVNNINRYREQLDKIGFCFDWDREVRTCEPGYYHWTQWAFQQMFNSFIAIPVHRHNLSATDRALRTERNRRTRCSLQRRTQLHSRRMECQKRKRTTGNPDELPHCLFGRNHGELVPATRNCSCQ